MTGMWHRQWECLKNKDGMMVLLKLQGRWWTLDQVRNKRTTRIIHITIQRKGTALTVPRTENFKIVFYTIPLVITLCKQFTGNVRYWSRRRILRLPLFFNFTPTRDPHNVHLYNNDFLPCLEFRCLFYFQKRLRFFNIATIFNTLLTSK